jgi:hypothetical protein
MDVLSVRWLSGLGFRSLADRFDSYTEDCSPRPMAVRRWVYETRLRWFDSFPGYSSGRDMSGTRGGKVQILPPRSCDGVDGVLRVSDRPGIGSWVKACHPIALGLFSLIVLRRRRPGASVVAWTYLHTFARILDIGYLLHVALCLEQSPTNQIGQQLSSWLLGTWIPIAFSRNLRPTIESLQSPKPSNIGEVIHN